MPPFPAVLITGASRGIGRGVALELARTAKFDLAINFAGNEAAARECQQLCQEASGGASRVEIVQGDISLAADRARLIEFVGQSFGRLDVLVNNAGVAPICSTPARKASTGSSASTSRDPTS